MPNPHNQSDHEDAARDRATEAWLIETVPTAPSWLRERFLNQKREVVFQGARRYGKSEYLRQMKESYELWVQNDGFDADHLP